MFFCVLNNLQSLPATFKMAFAGNREELAEKMDISHGLLLKLLDRQIITPRHRRAIQVLLLVHV